MSTNCNSFEMKNSVSHGNPEINNKKRVEPNNFQTMSPSHSNNSDGDDGDGDGDDGDGRDDDDDDKSQTGSSSFVNNELYKLRGQNWSQFFNLIKDEIEDIDKLYENVAHDTQKSSLLTKQVHRLDSNDMHIYGLHPKNTAIDMVVCNYCSGVYKLSGFKNHIKLRHPEIWDMKPNETIEVCQKRSRKFNETDMPPLDNKSTWTMDIDKDLDSLSPMEHELMPEEVKHNKYLSGSSKTLIKDKVKRKKYKAIKEPSGSIFSGVSSSIATSTYLNSKNNGISNSFNNTLSSAVQTSIKLETNKQSSSQDNTNYFTHLTNVSKKPNNLGNKYGFFNEGNNKDSSFRNFEPTTDISVNLKNTRPDLPIQSCKMNNNGDKILKKFSSKMAKDILDEKFSLEMPVYSLDMNSSPDLPDDIFDMNWSPNMPCDIMDINSSPEISDNILDMKCSTESQEDILDMNCSLEMANDILDMKIPVYSLNINSLPEASDDILDINLSPTIAESVLDMDALPEESDDISDINWLPEMPEELMDIDLSVIETTKNMKDSNPHVQTNSPENKYIIPEDFVINQLNTFQTNTPKMLDHFNMNTLLHNPSLFVNLTKNDSKANCSSISSNSDSQSSHKESSTYSENSISSINPSSLGFLSNITSSYSTLSGSNNNHMDTLLNAVKTSPNSRSNSYLRKDCKPVRNRRAALIPKLSKQIRSPDTQKRINNYIRGKKIQRKNILKKRETTKLTKKQPKEVGQTEENPELPRH